jgi:hypothetical protein
MVTWTNNDDRETYIANRWKPKKANVAPINSGQDDWRSAYLRKSFADNVNATREQNAINARNNDLQYAMSRSPSWYQNRDNLRSIKGVLESTPAVTTDMNESRNMYQMLMNQMKGGDRGARLIDTSGLPAGARRIGRTLFQDPSKSAGFRADLRNMLGDLTFQNKRLDPENRTSNPAAVRASEYNPFPKAGFGKEFYKDEFGGFNFGNLMEGIMKIATPLKYLPKRERTPLERDSRFYPENNVFDLEFDKVEPIPFMGEFEEDITETIDDGDIWESAAVEEVDFIPTDEDIKEAYEYIFKDSAYSDEYVGNSAIIDTRVPSLEQYLEAMQKPEYYEYINSTLKSKAKAEEMGLI